MARLHCRLLLLYSNHKKTIYLELETADGPTHGVWRLIFNSYQWLTAFQVKFDYFFTIYARVKRILAQNSLQNSHDLNEQIHFRIVPSHPLNVI